MKRGAKKPSDVATAAVGYVRVSTAEQADTGVSLDAQEDRIRAYCKMAGLQLVRIVREEGVSGSVSLSKRPQGQEVLRLLKEGRAGNVVALKLDRLFRDTVDALQQTKQWSKSDVGLHIVDLGGQTLNTKSGMGQFFLTMTAAFAELERTLISERTRAALSHKKAKNERVSYNVAFGYRLSGRTTADGSDLLEEEPAEQEVLRRMRELLADGYSYREIARELNRQGYRTRKGKSWNHVYVWKLLEKAA